MSEIKPTLLKTSVNPVVRTTPEINSEFLPGEIGAVLDWKVWAPKTGKVESEGMQKSKSFVRQFFDLFLIKISAHAITQPTQVRGIDNNLYEIADNNITFACNGGIGDVSKGIIVGTGVVAPTITDYAIGTIIPNDAGAHGAGTLQYSAVTFGAPASDGTTAQFTITRNFANATAGTITPTEIALYCLAAIPTVWAGILLSANQTPVSFMTIRDTIAGGINIGTGLTLTVNYRPQCVI